MGSSTEREPCPDRILDDLGGAFAMGAVGGMAYYFCSGAWNSPRGERLVGGIQTARMRAPRTGGGFAVWGGLFSAFDCSMAFLRRKEDPWNSIFAGAAAGGFLQIRHGLSATARSAAAGAVLLALIEGCNIAVMRMLEGNARTASMGDMGGDQIVHPGQLRQLQHYPNVDSGSGLGLGLGLGLGTGSGLGSGEDTEEGKGWFGGGSKKKETGSSSGSDQAKVLESFDSPTPMPNFEYK